MGLHIDFGVGDTIVIGDVEITLQKKTGHRSRVIVTADSALPISLKSAGGDDKVFSGGRGKTAHECSNDDKPLRGSTHGHHCNRGQ